uniref:Uncharacterized protein n=1 Tax=Triticum urartu TaxID=4572 RepID=A0A8R7TEB7_TRIUA
MRPQKWNSLGGSSHDDSMNHSAPLCPAHNSHQRAFPQRAHPRALCLAHHPLHYHPCHHVS